MLAKPPLRRSKRRRILKKYRKRWGADPETARQRWEAARRAILEGTLGVYRGVTIHVSQ